jgi:hypothetical protein
MRESERIPFVTFFALRQSYGADIQTFDFAKKKKGFKFEEIFLLMLLIIH